MTNQSKINAPEVLPQAGGTLFGMSGAGVAPAGKQERKQPYVAPSFTTTDVDIEPFCVPSAKIHGNSNMDVMDWEWGDELNPNPDTNVGDDIVMIL